MCFYSQCQKALVSKSVSLQLFAEKIVKGFDVIENQPLLHHSFYNYRLHPSVFIFFYAFTLGLRDANSNLKIRKILHNFIRKLF